MVSGPKISNRLDVARAEIFLQNLRVIVVATLITAAVVAAMLWPYLSHQFLLVWLILFTVLTGLRYSHFRQCENVPTTEANVGGRMQIVSVFAFLSGSMWGWLGYHGISSDDPITSVLILMVFTGLVANATATMSHVRLSYLCFIVPVLLPAAFKFFTFGQAQYYWITGLIFFYLSVSVLTSKGIRNSIDQSIKLRYENLDLIDSLKVQNDATEHALSEAEQASLSKSRFLAAASHDLRQPMQSLGMFAASLANQPLNQSQQGLVSSIQKSIVSLEELFNALLDVSTLDAGTTTVQSEHILLKQRLAPLLDEVEEQCAAKGLSFVNGVENCAVYTDPVLLERIVRNLAQNAVHYTSEGFVSIRCQRQGERVEVSIEDSGKGIDEIDQQKIFEEFVQLDNPERDRSKGLGLGLSIVRRLCEMLDIKLELTSALYKGSQFRIKVPSGDFELARLSAEQAIPPATQALDLFVLLIDDEEDIRVSMEGLLMDWGCTVMLASSGNEAVQQLIEFDQTPQVVISDFRLRDNETGGMAISAVRKHCGQHLPAIIITGDIASNRLQDMDSLNIPVLHKPCDPDELRRLLAGIKTE